MALFCEFLCLLPFTSFSAVALRQPLPSAVVAKTNSSVSNPWKTPGAVTRPTVFCGLCALLRLKTPLSKNHFALNYFAKYPISQELPYEFIPV